MLEDHLPLLPGLLLIGVGLAFPWIFYLIDQREERRRRAQWSTTAPSSGTPGRSSWSGSGGCGSGYGGDCGSSCGSGDSGCGGDGGGGGD